jgi:cytochrome c5
MLVKLQEEYMNNIMKVVLAVGLVAGTVSPAVAARTGKEVYEKVCIGCHGAGVAGSTKIGDKKWIELEKKEGMKSLVREAIKGERAMPPKGGCGDCTEDEIRAAVKYLVDSAKKK